MVKFREGFQTFTYVKYLVFAPVIGTFNDWHKQYSYPLLYFCVRILLSLYRKEITLKQTTEEDMWKLDSGRGQRMENLRKEKLRNLWSHKILRHMYQAWATHKIHTNFYSEIVKRKFTWETKGGIAKVILKWASGTYSLKWRICCRNWDRLV